MERKLIYNVITILINSFFFISSYFLIKEMNLHTVHLIVSIFISFVREITRFRCIYLTNESQSINNRRSIHNYNYFLLFLKIINVLNIFLLITNENQYIYVDYRLLIVYYIYDIACIFIFPKIILEVNASVPLRPRRINNKKITIIKIDIKQLDYNNIEQCYICCDRKGNNTILDCNHDMICGVCIFKIDKCPICRGNITEIIELFVMNLD